MILSLNRITCIILFASFIIQLNATEYFVDFKEGKDLNDGRTRETAWKHCPGDKNAKGNPALVHLLPGDILLFRGGVAYCGEIRINHDGVAGNPVIYKGDGWGNEKAIIEGADRLALKWTQCSSASESKGNANFKNIYYTDLPANFDFFSGFYEDQQFLWFAQDPNPSSRFNYDNIRDFYPIPQERHFTTTELTDPAYFNQADPQYWLGSYIIAWHKPNVTTVHPITSFKPVTGTITFTDLGGGGIYTDRTSFYAILNHPSHIDQPGEYCTDPVLKRIYLWPLHSDDPGNHDYFYNTRRFGIVYSGRKNVVIEGFEVRNFVLGIISDSRDTENIIIRNNVVKNLRSNDKYAIQMSGKDIKVENNRVEDCIRAVGILAAGKNISVQGNFIKNTSRQGIWFMGVNRGTILNNTVTDIRGTHSNAISAYLYNENILVAGNRVLNSNISFTFHGETSMPDLRMNLTLYNNYFESSCNGWGNSKYITVINNVCRRGFFFSDTDTCTILINNVVLAGNDADDTRNNIYLSPGPAGRGNKVQGLKMNGIDWSDKEISDIFKDITKGDVRLKSGSPAINAGIDPMQYLPVKMFPEYDFNRDIYGNKRPAGNAWDIGVHEYD
jgi:hypothetical protein